MNPSTNKSSGGPTDGKSRERNTLAGVSSLRIVEDGTRYFVFSQRMMVSRREPKRWGGHGGIGGRVMPIPKGSHLLIAVISLEHACVRNLQKIRTALLCIGMTSFSNGSFGTRQILKGIEFKTHYQRLLESTSSRMLIRERKACGTRNSFHRIHRPCPVDFPILWPSEGF